MHFVNHCPRKGKFQRQFEGKLLAKTPLDEFANRVKGANSRKQTYSVAAYAIACCVVQCDAVHFTHFYDNH